MKIVIVDKVVSISQRGWLVIFQSLVLTPIDFIRVEMEERAKGKGRDREGRRKEWRKWYEGCGKIVEARWRGFAGKIEVDVSTSETC